MPDELYLPANPQPKPDEPITAETLATRDAGKKRAYREAEEMIARGMRGDKAS